MCYVRDRCSHEVLGYAHFPKTLVSHPIIAYRALSASSTGSASEGSTMATVLVDGSTSSHAACTRHANQLHQCLARHCTHCLLSKEQDTSRPQDTRVLLKLVFTSRTVIVGQTWDPFDLQSGRRHGRNPSQCSRGDKVVWSQWSLLLPGSAPKQIR